MTGLAILLLEVAACVGFGATLLRGLNIRDSLPWGERLATAFILGIGLLGWLMFCLGVTGLFNVVAVAGLLILGVVGLGCLGRPDMSGEIKFSAMEKVLLAVLLAALFLDVMEGLSPPADADSLAYHFALPKLFWQTGELIFIPRAVDGAIPLLVQMTYIPVLGLGGEKALTLWTMVSGWGVAWALYFLCRRRLDRTWSLAIVLIWLTTPAILYGGGSGQIEVRNAGFIIIALAALLRGRETGLLRYTVLAGLAVGMFVGAKYTGLLFAAACGFAVLTLPRRFKQACLFSAAVVLVGFQWYAWNWVHTGDPVFPMLFGLLETTGYEFWDAAHHQAMRENLFVGERALDISLWSAAIYPFLATFSTSIIFDSARAGLGPIFLMAMPFALVGLWRYRGRLLSSPLSIIALALIFYYGLWFFSGSSQRVRHLVPIYPVALMLVLTLSCYGAQAIGAVRVLGLAVVLTLGLQMAGHGASSINYLKYQFSSEGRDHFLARNIAGYDAAVWINKNLQQTDRILVDHRQLMYLLEVPTYYAHASNENFVDTRPEASNPALYYRQLKALGMTHILVTSRGTGNEIASGHAMGGNQWKTIFSMGCAKEIGRVPYRGITSRSLAISEISDLHQLILQIGGQACPLETAAGDDGIAGKVVLEG